MCGSCVADWAWVVGAAGTSGQGRAARGGRAGRPRAGGGPGAQPLPVPNSAPLWRRCANPSPLLQGALDILKQFRKSAVQCRGSNNGAKTFLHYCALFCLYQAAWTLWKRHLYSPCLRKTSKPAQHWMENLSPNACARKLHDSASRPQVGMRHPGHRMKTDLVQL